MTPYLLSISAAAVLCLLVQKLLEGKGAACGIGKMLSGIFLILSILQPFTDRSWTKFEDISFDFLQDGTQAVSNGESMARKQLRDSISQRTSAYILDKAKNYDALLTVEVTLSDDQIPVPISVAIRGNISPYGKRQLQSIIENDLGISREDQLWI